MPKGEKLTPKQEAFIRAYLGGKNPKDAYEQAYDVKRMSPAAVAVEAQKLLQHPNVSKRLNALQAKQEVKTLLSLEEHMEKLKELRDAAHQEGDFSPAIKAEELRGKLRRFYVEQIEHGGVGDFDRMNEDEILDHIERQEQTIQTLLSPSTRTH